MAEWIYFLQPPRADFATTMTAEEKTAWAAHFRFLQHLLEKDTLVLAGPTLGKINTGVVIFEARDEASARRIMEGDPTIRGGFAAGELQPFRISLLRGRNDLPGTA